MHPTEKSQLTVLFLVVRSPVAQAMVVVEGTEVEELDWQLDVCLEVSTGMLKRVDAEDGVEVGVSCGVSGVDGDSVTWLSVTAQPV